MFCTSCAEPLTPGARFCGQCASLAPGGVAAPPRPVTAPSGFVWAVLWIALVVLLNGMGEAGV